MYLKQIMSLWNLFRLKAHQIRVVGGDVGKAGHALEGLQNVGQNIEAIINVNFYLVTQIFPFYLCNIT